MKKRCGIACGVDLGFLFVLAVVGESLQSPGAEGGYGGSKEALYVGAPSISLQHNGKITCPSTNVSPRYRLLFFGKRSYREFPYEGHWTFWRRWSKMIGNGRDSGRRWSKMIGNARDPGYIGNLVQILHTVCFPA